MADQGAISLDEFKARLPLVELVGGHVRLTRRGREHLGLCPFHQEKTPSFTVSEAKGFYHCFGCGQHGNAIDFIMAIEGLEFAPAIARLAELTGLPAPYRAGAGAAPVDRTLYAVNEAAARWFAGRLESAQGAEAAAYLQGRGLDHATILRFGLGYAPAERTGLKRALQAEGYPEQAALEAGLLVQPEDGPCYDRFRHRVTFPIHDPRGRVVGFGGRALGEAQAKYLNSPDTPLFHKGELLYGLALARPAVRQHGSVVVAEGYMDVIALAQAGFANAVAPLGTAVTEAQLALLWQLADEPVVCLDGDEAGLRAAHRLIERALPVLKPGKSLRFALLPAGQDPDSLLRSAGRGALERRLADALPLIEFLWRRELAGRSLSTPERRAALTQRWHQLAQSVVDRELRWRFRQEAQQRLRTAFAPYEPRRRVQQPAARGQVPAGVGAQQLLAFVAKPELAAERELLGPILNHPALLDEVEEEFASIKFSDDRLDRVQQAILSWYCDRRAVGPDDLGDYLLAVGLSQLATRLCSGPMWYREDAELNVVLDKWRSRFAQHHDFNALRTGKLAASTAILGLSDEASTFRREVDRLANEAAKRRLDD